MERNLLLTCPDVADRALCTREGSYVDQPDRPVLLLGSIPHILLAVARSLGRSGIEVHVGLEWPSPALAQSRYVARVFDLPRYREAPEAWLQSLQSLAQRQRYALIIPCGDWENLLCHVHRRALSPLTKLAIPSAAALDTLTDKAAAGCLARAHGVSTPRELLVASAEAPWAPPPDGFAFPLYLKPRRSFDLAHPGLWQRVIKAAGPEQFREGMAVLGSRGDVLIQEAHPGEGVGVELLMRQGRSLLAFQHRRVHQPRDGGPSSYRASMDVTGHLHEAALRLLGPLRYTGVAMVEFLVDPATGQWTFLEVNPRFWGSLPLAVAAGADFPRGLYQLMLDQPVDVSADYRRDIFCRNWSMDAAWFGNELRRGRSGRWPRALAHLGINLLTLRERSDSFTLDDPRPALLEARQMLRRLTDRKHKRA